MPLEDCRKLGWKGKTPHLQTVASAGQLILCNKYLQARVMLCLVEEPVPVVAVFSQLRKPSQGFSGNTDGKQVAPGGGSSCPCSLPLGSFRGNPPSSRALSLRVWHWVGSIGRGF